VARELRRHYTVPTFLPDDSESSNLDWLFMGGFGGGANIHVCRGLKDFTVPAAFSHCYLKFV